MCRSSTSSGSRVATSSARSKIAKSCAERPRRHADARASPDSIEIRRQSFSRRRRQRQHAVRGQAHAGHFRHIVHRSRHANPRRHGAAYRLPARCDRRTARRRPRPACGPPAARSRGMRRRASRLPARNRSARASNCSRNASAAVRAAARNKAKILAGHKRSGGNLSILSACDSPRIQLQASMSSAPMATASFASMKAFIVARSS